MKIIEDGTISDLGPLFTYDSSKVSSLVTVGPNGSLHEYLKALNHQVMYTPKRVNRMIGAGMLGVAVATLATGPGVFILAGAALSGTYISASLKKIRSSPENVYSITKQDGWNWSVNPKKVSASVFKDYEIAVDRSFTPQN